MHDLHISSMGWDYANMLLKCVHKCLYIDENTKNLCVVDIFH